MKRFIGLFLVIFFPFLLVSPVFAESDSTGNIKTGRTITLPSDQTLNKDFFAFGGTVEISGTVNGDVYAFGGEITVDGTINGDLIAAGGTINFSGTAQNVRVAGGQISIEGKVNRNLTVASGNVNITKSALLGGSLVVAGGNVSLSAPVNGDVSGGVGKLTISNVVNGNVNITSGSLRLASKAVVNGDLNNWSGNEASIDENAKISGQKTKNSPIFEAPKREEVFAAFAGFSLLLKIASFFSTLVLGLLLIKFFPGYTKTAVETIRKRPLASIGLGVLGILLGLLATVVLAVTIIGIPLSIMFGILLFIAIYIARVFAVVFIGKFILQSLNRQSGLGWALLLGLFVYMIVQGLPIIGGFVTLLVVLSGFGANLLTKKEFYQNPKIKPIL